MTEHEYKARGKRFAVIRNFKIIQATSEKSKDPEFRSKLWQRMWKMEGIFAEAKNFHGLRRARYRSRSKVQIQVYVISTVQNLKRLASAAILITKAIWFELKNYNLSPEIFRKIPATA